MIILSAKEIQKSYGIDMIIKDASFTLQEKDKVGVVGVNGAGKSTLFKIIAGIEEKDKGDLYIGKSISIGYMSQFLDFESDTTLWQEMLKVFSDIREIENRMKQLEKEISSINPGTENERLDSLMKAYSSLQQQYENNEGFAYESKIRGVLKGLGFSPEDYDKRIALFSGGQKTRVALGKVLLEKRDILLLDEPTNYLDIEAVEWLEGFLKDYKGALMIISHDRYLLDNVTNRTFEVENGKLTEYEGNYTYYVAKKQELREQLQKEYENQQKEIARQEAIIARYRQYNREKSIRQAESREKLLEKMEKIDKPETLPQKAHFKFEPQFRSGNDVLKLENLSKAFSRPLFNNLSLEIKRGDKIALLGPNGIGKTTLLKIIAGKIRPDEGTVRFGTSVFTAYYDQEQESLNHNKMIIDEVWDVYPGLNETAIRNALAAFLFKGEDVFKEISVLSGGEKSRIALLKLMLSKANFLLLDEPTNHLDMESKGVLEEALSGYTGTVLFVSHDRYFINKVANKVVELSAQGAIVYNGGYSYYLMKRNLFKDNDNKSKENDGKISDIKNDWLKQKEEKAKERKQQKRIEAIEKEIGEAESRIAEIDQLLTQPDIYSDHVKCNELSKEKEELTKKIDDLFEEWADLQ
ncbi:ABC-F family ATP-binding cassette domain-containing protein [Lutispora thermophila]|uniref:ATP-binding cassette, subfamily F, member 3 n=1 Tax=Lutispora thermophila DSM 19022 TaxID=1122184 RepID=A0A1M6AUE3_9FIRM|nr:ABC-F type ribosomal protection protein [Lutispora thermophila]SHI39938.1 ATP-binding cassette, subfamily F, member 3 [Lutispora thermophila DSM 19022]